MAGSEAGHDEDFTSSDLSLTPMRSSRAMTIKGKYVNLCADCIKRTVAAMLVPSLWAPAFRFVLDPDGDRQHGREHGNQGGQTKHRGLQPIHGHPQRHV